MDSSFSSDAENKTSDAVSEPAFSNTEGDKVVSTKKTSASRARLFGMLALSVAVVGGAYYAYDVLYASKHVTTDNAYVGANVAQVTPLISGTVAEVLVDGTQIVKKGDILVRLDDTDARLAFNKAAAALSLAKRNVRGLIAKDDSLGSHIAARQADLESAKAYVTSAQANVEKAKVDLQRREALESSGSVSGDEITVAKNALLVAIANLRASEAAQIQAEASLRAAKGDLAANHVMIEGTSVNTNPQVLQAQAAYEQAKIDLSRTVLRAPMDGVVSRRQVQIGQRVQLGTSLMVVVPLNDLYVDANFKEGKLTNVKPGQHVTLTSDLYGEDVEYKGTVVGFSGGTGAAFSIIPAQNATGNWIKVVQRLPVRIALDPAELKANPLRVGLSMQVDVNIAE